MPRMKKRTDDPRRPQRSGRQRRRPLLPSPSPRTLLPLLLLLLTALRPAASQTWEASNDPDGLCSPNKTGYYATRDCRGYAYCNDGYLMGGETISCWPNQLFDAERGTCTRWQDVDRSAAKCPDFDGTTMMPDQEDANANPELFYCGVSASNARRVCEPCPGGSRLECTDPTHNCFAGITGCPKNAPEPAPRPVPEPTQFAVVNAPSVGNGNDDNNNADGGNDGGAGHPTSSDLSNELYLHGALRSSYYCGWSWETTIRGCLSARPCPTGLNDECPTGQACFPDTPCGEAAGPTPKPTRRPVTEEERGYYCGFDWAWVVDNCARSTPCPYGDAIACPSGMKCIAGTPCWAINEGLPTPKPTPMPVVVSFPPVKGDDPTLRYCGHDWSWVVQNCARATPCPLGDANVCPSGMECIANTPCRAINNEMEMTTQKPTPLPTKKTYPPVQGDDTAKRFCGYDWADVTANCLTAIPCPGGVAQGVCPDKMNCIAETQCADEAYLQFLREQQAKNGSGKPVLQAKPGPAPTIAAPTPPAATTNASDGDDARCTSDGDCQAGRFCHRPDPSEAGHCGACVPSSGAGCSTEQVCRTPGCHGGLTEPGVTKCFERWDPWELNKDCEMRLNDADAKCDVDTMLCSSGQSQEQNGAGSGSDAGVSASMYENEEGNSFFCGETYAGITGNCLLSKPCPGGLAENYCEDNEGCFRAPSCEEEYAAAANGVTNPDESQSVTEEPDDTILCAALWDPVCGANGMVYSNDCEAEAAGAAPSTAIEDATDDLLPGTTCDPSQNSMTNAVNSEPPKESTSPVPTQGPTINTRFCGVTWADHAKDCANSLPCPRGDECPNGESCFTGSPCAMLANGPENASSNVGNFCGTTWNDLMVTCESATKCTPGGEECAKGEFCYQDFTCDPPPTTTAPTMASPAPTTPMPSKAPTINTNFCGVSWADHAKDCTNSLPCPRGDECPDGESCFRGSPCAVLANSPGNSDPKVGNFCATTWNDLMITCESATKCTPGGDECADGEFCYQDFTCDPPPTTTAPTMASPAAGQPNSNSLSLAPTTPMPSKAPTINTNFCGESWADHAKDCANSLPCPRGDECPDGESCFRGSPCAVLANGPSNSDPKVGNFCATKWNDLMFTCESATKCTPGGDECAGGEFCYQDFTCDPPPTTTAPTMASPAAGQPNSNSLSLAPTTPVPSKAPTINTNFCGVSWADHAKNCANSLPCPRGDECPDGESCFRGSPCAVLSNGPGISDPKVGNFCGTTWNELNLMCMSATKCTPGGNECGDGEFCYQDFTCNPPPTTTPTISNSPIAVAPALTSLLLSNATTTSMPSKSPTINTNFCGVSWAEHAKDCENSLPCPRGDECPDGQSCFRGSACAKNSAPAKGPGDGKTNVGNFCGTTWNELNLMCMSATKCTPGGNECAEGEFCYQDFTCNPPPTATPTITMSPTGSPIVETAPALASLLLAAPTTSNPSKSPTINTNFCGVSWADHAKDCENSLPCPRGDECAPGESCFQGSPCASTSANNPENANFLDSNVGDYCGSTWNELNMMCKSATKCPNGDGDCSEGEMCYKDFVCDPPLDTSMNSTNDANSDSNFGNFCGTTWNDLNMMCKSATRCTPGGNECAEGEFCYQDFTCDPPPVTENNVPMGGDGGLTSGSGQGTTPFQPEGESCSLCDNSQVDWSSGVKFEFSGEAEWNTDISCGEFEWIFRAENILEGSTQCLDFRAEYFERCCYAKPEQNGCNLCDAGMGEPWHDMRGTVNVMFEGFETTCADLSNKVRTRFDPSSDECAATKAEHFETCCFERCSLCGDANLDWESNVIFSGDEVLCHELDQTIFPENHVAAGSTRCMVSQGFYADSCCITPPVEPCNLCSSNGIHFNMKSNEKVSYKGEVQTCLEVYHSLISRREQQGIECIDAQEVVFDQCCEILNDKSLPGGTSGGGADGADGASSPPNMFPTKKPTADFESWYTGSLDSSAFSLTFSVASLCLSIAMGLISC